MPPNLRVFVACMLFCVRACVRACVALRCVRACVGVAACFRVCLSVCLSACMYVCPCPSLSLSLFLYLPVLSLPVCLSVCRHVCMVRPRHNALLAVGLRVHLRVLAACLVCPCTCLFCVALCSFYVLILRACVTDFANCNYSCWPNTHPQVQTLPTQRQAPSQDPHQTT